ncbi:MAG: hypothetical protein JSS72_00735 [Armatimonadetes bacterium]|nr:hypothetical protein [Armatimonadota bacterium]
MLRIVGVQRSNNPSDEFVVLQNHGTLRMQLRGHLVIAEAAFANVDLDTASHLFTDDALVPAGMYVALLSGYGAARWTQTKDMQMVYYTYMNRDKSVWERFPGALHLLNVQHTYQEREALLLR